MRRSIKATITVLIFAALVAISAFSIAEAVRHRPGTRTQWERQQLREWLLSPAAAEPSVDDERVMARRAAAAFRLGFDWPELLDALDEQQRQLIERNFQLLTRVWLVDHADDWLRLPAKRRAQSLDREVQALLDWKLPSGRDNTAALPETDAARLDRLRAAAAVCLASVPGNERKHVFELLDAARGHVLARGWMKWLPGSD